MDTTLGWASPSTRWGFVIHHRLPGLASCHGTDFHFVIGVGLLLSSGYGGNISSGRRAVGVAPHPVEGAGQ
jgi:hypothetical protein